jgi:hypothetical protein
MFLNSLQIVRILAWRVLPKVAKAWGKRGRPAAAAAVLVELIGYIAVPGVVYIGL